MKSDSARESEKPTTYYSNRREEMMCYLPGEFERVLEIGCGDGTFLKQLPQNCEVWGVEINQQAAAQAKKSFEKIVCGSFNDVAGRLPDAYFDLIIANDVIEHVDDYHLLFLNIHKKLKPAGRLVGSVPNVRYWSVMVSYVLGRDWRYEGTGILDTTHLRFFTRKSLVRTLGGHGFEIELLSPCNRLKFYSLGIKPLFRFLFAHAAVIVTLGYFKDVLAFQYGFRAIKTGR
jgi:2-polyprenyl-3-methyl-5-hydroxy-6-metoxy-1,4-benzoquinol methylase